MDSENSNAKMVQVHGSELDTIDKLEAEVARITEELEREEEYMKNLAEQSKDTREKLAALIVAVKEAVKEAVKRELEIKQTKKKEMDSGNSSAKMVEVHDAELAIILAKVNRIKEEYERQKEMDSENSNAKMVEVHDPELAIIQAKVDRIKEVLEREKKNIKDLAEELKEAKEKFAGLFRVVKEVIEV